MDGRCCSVFCRIREPCPENEQVIFKWTDKTVMLHDLQAIFQFDHVFDPLIPEETIYNIATKPLIKTFMEGRNCVLMLYGQTGSGKSHVLGTDTGTHGQLLLCLNELFEIFSFLSSNNLDYQMLSSNQNNKDNSSPTSNNNILAQNIDLLSNFDNINYTLYASFIQIYNEKVSDLLVDRADGIDLKIYEGENSNMFIKGVTKVKLTSLFDALTILQKGIANRVTSPHLMNQSSSRSHSVYTLFLEASNAVAQKISKFHFVDLAGSERVSKTAAVGSRFKESTKINAGLLNLSNVITALSDNSTDHTFIPYRSSKLTYLLKDSLCRSGLTHLIACINPVRSNLSECCSTLKYATRMCMIRSNYKPLTLKLKTKEELYALVTALSEKLRQYEQVLNEGGNKNNNANNDPLDCLTNITEELKPDSMLPSEGVKLNETNQKTVEQLNSVETILTITSLPDQDPNNFNSVNHACLNKTPDAHFENLEVKSLNQLPSEIELQNLFNHWISGAPLTGDSLTINDQHDNDCCLLNFAKTISKNRQTDMTLLNLLNQVKELQNELTDNQFDDAAEIETLRENAEYLELLKEVKDIETYKTDLMAALKKQASSLQTILQKPINLLYTAVEDLLVLTERFNTLKTELRNRKLEVTNLDYKNSDLELYIRRIEYFHYLQLLKIETKHANDKLWLVTAIKNWIEINFSNDKNIPSNLLTKFNDYIKNTESSLDQIKSELKIRRKKAILSNDYSQRTSVSYDKKKIDNLRVSLSHDQKKHTLNHSAKVGSSKRHFSYDESSAISCNNRLSHIEQLGSFESLQSLTSDIIPTSTLRYDYNTFKFNTNKPQSLFSFSFSSDSYDNSLDITNSSCYPSTKRANLMSSLITDSQSNISQAALPEHTKHYPSLINQFDAIDNDVYQTISFKLITDHMSLPAIKLISTKQHSFYSLDSEYLKCYIEIDDQYDIGASLKLDEVPQDLHQINETMFAIIYRSKIAFYDSRLNQIVDTFTTDNEILKSCSVASKADCFGIFTLFQDKICLLDARATNKVIKSAELQVSNDLRISALSYCNSITDKPYSFDGMLVGMESGVVRLWNDGWTLMPSTFHSSRISSIISTDKSQVFAAKYGDPSLMSWKVDDGRCIIEKIKDLSLTGRLKTYSNKNAIFEANTTAIKNANDLEKVTRTLSESVLCGAGLNLLSCNDEYVIATTTGGSLRCWRTGKNIVETSVDFDISDTNSTNEPAQWYDNVALSDQNVLMLSSNLKTIEFYSMSLHI